MPVEYEIKTEFPRHKERFVESFRGFYLCEDGSRVSVCIIPVWCRSCGTIVEGEDVRSVEQIDKLISELKDEKSMVYQFLEPAGPLAATGRRFRLD
jgi:hypothetical protein